MSITAQGTQIRCDAPNCAQPATIDEGAWGFCATHAGKSKATDTAPRPTGREHLSRAHTPLAATAHTFTVSNAPNPIGLLLEQASAHSSKRVVTLAARIEGHLDQLRELVGSLAEDEQRKQAAKLAKEKARAEIARLEGELAAARAVLRGDKKPKPATSRSRVDQQLSCRKGYGQILASPQGRGKHEHHCKGAVS